MPSDFRTTATPHSRWIMVTACMAILGLSALTGCSRGTVTSVPSPQQPEPKKVAEIGRWSGIDVGSKGVKPITFTFVQMPDGWDFMTDTVIESKNTDLGTLTSDGRSFDADRLAATIKAVVEMDKTIQDKHKIPPERVRIAVSSGVLSRFTNAESAAAAKAQLSKAIEAAVGRAPTFIDERQEAEFAARAIISPVGREGRMVIDIGSGNTKLGWFTEAGFQNATLDSGTKAFRDKAAALAAEKKQSFTEAAAYLRDSILTQELRKKLATAPGVDKIKDVQLIGGAPWALTTFTHPGTTKEMRVVLSAADLDTFAKLVQLKPEVALKQIEASITDPAARETAIKEVERVQKVFTPEELQAAAELLRLTFKELKLDEPHKKVVFFQKGQYAWIAGYLMIEAKLPG